MNPLPGGTSVPATLPLPSSSLPRDPLFQVSVLGCPDPAVHEIAYQYGKNVGIAFQVGLLLWKGAVQRAGRGGHWCGGAVTALSSSPADRRRPGLHLMF